MDERTLIHVHAVGGRQGKGEKLFHREHLLSLLKEKQFVVFDMTDGSRLLPLNVRGITEWRTL